MKPVTHLAVYREKKQLQEMYKLYAIAHYSKKKNEEFEQALFSTYGDSEELTEDSLYEAFVAFRIMLDVHLSISI